MAAPWARDPTATIRGMHMHPAAPQRPTGSSATPRTTAAVANPPGSARPAVVQAGAPQMHRAAVAHMQAAQAHMQAAQAAAQAQLQAEACAPQAPAPRPTHTPIPAAAPQPHPAALSQPTPAPAQRAPAPQAPARWYTASPQQDVRPRMAPTEAHAAARPATAPATADLHASLQSMRTPAVPAPGRIPSHQPPVVSRTVPGGAGALPRADGGEKIPGLRALLEAVKLHGYLEAAETWCEGVGAVDLAEVLEEVDGLSEALGLKMMEKRRLRKVAEQGSTAKLPSAGPLELQSPSGGGRMRPSLAAERTDSPVQHSAADCLGTTLIAGKVTPTVRSPASVRTSSQDPPHGRPRIEVHVEQIERAASPPGTVRFHLPPTAPTTSPTEEASHPPPVPGLALGRLTSSRSMEPLDSPAKAELTRTPCTGSRSTGGLHVSSADDSELLSAPPLPIGTDRSPKKSGVSPKPFSAASRTQSQPAPRTCTQASLAVKSRRGSRERLPKYGLDAELEAKAAAKYDTDAEEEAAQWVQEITGAEVIDDFFPMLKSGEVLCQLVNAIQPNSVPKVNCAGMPFRERENISNFLKACRALGVQEYALFSTDDLYDENNLMSVVKCLHALGGTVQRTVPEFRGPHLGVADTSNAKRDQKRDQKPVTQTGGLQCALERLHVDRSTHHQIVRGGC